MSRQQQKRKPRGLSQPAVRPKRQKRVKEFYEDDVSDPDEEKHTARYDRVDNYEYEMPSDFEDEEIDEEMAFTAEDKAKYANWFDDHAGAKHERGNTHGLDSSEEDGSDASDEFEDGGDGSDWDDGADGEEGGLNSQDAAGLPTADSEQLEEDEEEEADDDEDAEEAHRAMLQAVLGEGHGKRQRKQARQQVVVAEAYPESEHYAGAVAAGEGELQLSDLIAGLGEQASKLGSARKLLDKMGRSAAPISAPLPRQVAERVARKAAYVDTSKDVSKWQPVIKANREAPTLRFTSAAAEVPRTAGSTAALVATHTPEGDLEQEVADLLAKAGVSTAAAMAEAEEQLAVKALTLEEAQERQARLAKMRNLMFYAELKAKRLAKIKSKEYRRHANKAAKRAAAKAAALGGEHDVEEAVRAAREVAEEAEFERAKERLTLKHRNTSKWARRALKRGVQVMDEGTKAALAEQLALGAQLRRKIEGKGSGSSGSDGSTSASEGEEAGDAAAAGSGRWRDKARQEALSIMQELMDPAAAAAAAGQGGSSKAKSGLFALPFMQRALEKQRAAAAEEAAAMVQEAEGGEGEEPCGGRQPGGGRRQFGGPQQQQGMGAEQADADLVGSSEDDMEDTEAKAERLGRVLSGAAAGPSSAATAAGSQEQRTRAGRAATQQQQQQQQPGGEGAAGGGEGRASGNMVTRTAGFVDVDLPDVAAAAAGAATSDRAATKAKSGGAAAAAGGTSASAAAVTAAVNSSRSEAGWLFEGPDGTAGASTSSGPAPFVPARTFGGAKEGYVFKRGKQGVGYYLDAPAALKGKAAKKAAKKQQQQQQQGVAGALPKVLVHSAGGADSDGDDPVPQQQPGGLNGHLAGAGSAQQQQQQRGEDGHSSGDDEQHRAEMRPMENNAELQRRLLQQAFAGDDVAAEFAAEKATEVEAELPAVDAPSALPGWGSWSHQQKEPAWMIASRKKAEQAKSAAAAARKDAKLQNVILSEKWDKKAAKYLAPSLPFPYNSPAVYEASIRRPLGRETNTDAAFRNLTRPAVLKDSGVVIQPMRYSQAVADSARSGAGAGRAVVTVAGGMVKEGQQQGSGAGGLGKGLTKKAKQAAKRGNKS